MLPCEGGSVVMIPWGEWWFWLLVLALLAVFGEVVENLIRAFRNGSSKELRELRHEVEKLREELKEAKAVQRALELQRKLSQRELKQIEQQALPEGLAVLMFTDLEGFTEYLDRHGDERALRRLQRHHEIIKRCVERHQGLIVKELGDGFLLGFASARRALLCAAEIQQLIERSGLSEELKVRIGLHAGEPVKDGRDVLGHVVNVAERIMEHAHGGQILLSQLVKELTGSLEGFQFVELGERRLKGLRRPISLYELQPVRALAHPLDSDIDRELEELERQLRKGGAE